MVDPPLAISREENGAVRNLKFALILYYEWERTKKKYEKIIVLIHSKTVTSVYYI